MSNRTETPWWVEGKRPTANGNLRVMGAACSPVAIVPEHQSEDADLIVLAVNNHDALVGALKKLLSANVYGDVDAWNAVIDEARAVVERIEEGR